MTKKNIKQVLAMSNSAIGRWAARDTLAHLPLEQRQVLGYCRYSSGGGQHEATIEKQEEFITVHARNKGMHSPRFYKDRAVRGTTDDRAAWKALIRQVRPGTIVLVHEITRLARETFTALKMIRQVQVAGGTVELVNSASNDAIYLTIMSAVAEYDYRSVVTRLRDGRVQAVAKGMPYRRPSYGYDKVGKEFVINEARARWVREIFRMRLEGASIGQIMRYVAANNRTEGRWSPDRVNKILYSPLYAGYLVQKRPVFSWETQYPSSSALLPAEVPPTVDMDMAPVPTAGDGDPFGLKVDKSSGLLDDVIISHVPQLAMVEFKDFLGVLAMRPAPGERVKKEGGLTLHPLRGRWKCPRCGGEGTLHIKSRQQSMHCRNAIALPGAVVTCNAPPIDLAMAENLMFRALESFAPGREGKFAQIARERYDELIEGAQTERKQNKERADHLRSKLKKISRELLDNQNNRHVRDQLQRDANDIGSELDQLDLELQDMPAEPDDPDPKTSLLELQNMIAMVKTETPFGSRFNPEVLRVHNRLQDVIVAVTMVEKGDDVYEVEFHLNVSAALDREGRTIEIVRFQDQNLKAGRFRERYRLTALRWKWSKGDYAISDRAWKKRPALPDGELKFGENLRWTVDVMIMTAETTLGTRTAVELAGSAVSDHIVQYYRASEECETLRQWLQQVRPRKHEYAKMRPKPNALTLRQRLEEIRHPLLELDRCQRTAEPSSLTDAECAKMFEVLDEVEPRYYASMRNRVDHTVEMLRANLYAPWGGKQCYYGWLKYQTKRGTFIKIVNFLRSLEGRPPCTTLPEMPNGRRRKVQKIKATVGSKASILREIAGPPATGGGDRHLAQGHPDG